MTADWMSTWPRPSRVFTWVPWLSFCLLFSFGLVGAVLDFHPSHFAWVAKYGPPDEASQRFESVFRAVGVPALVAVLVLILSRWAAGFYRFSQRVWDSRGRLNPRQIEALVFWIGCGLVLVQLMFVSQWFGD